MKNGSLFIKAIIFSVAVFFIANFLANIIAPSSESMEVLMVCIIVLLSFIVGILGVVLQEIGNLKK